MFYKTTIKNNHYLLYNQNILLNFDRCFLSICITLINYILYILLYYLESFYYLIYNINCRHFAYI